MTAEAEQTIAVASDHAGFRLKEELKSLLTGLGFKILDLGPANEESVDYPDFGAAVAARVSRGEIKRGILMCGSGIGMSIVANKFPGVRAALAYNEDTARLSREHNDANILVVAARTQELKLVKRMVEIWLTTPFAGGRHQKRLDKITAWEEKILSHKGLG